MVRTKDMIELVKGHYSSDKNKFERVLTEVIKHEEKNGSEKTANKLQTIQRNATSQLVEFESILNGRIQFVNPVRTLKELYQDEAVIAQLKQIELEHLKEDKLLEHQLQPTKKIMLLGSSGTGKTMSAEIIANLLDMPLGIIHTEQIMSSRLGETPKNLVQVFDEMKKRKAVYFFDEFDSLAKSRNTEDVGEMSRIVNTLLLQIEKFDNYLVVASNFGDLIDSALIRRFDMKIKFNEPNEKDRLCFIEQKLEKEFRGEYPIDKLVAKSKGMNYSGIEKEIIKLKKHAILQDEMPLTYTFLDKSFANE